MAEAKEIRLAVLDGDGIGPEITAATTRIVGAAAASAGLKLVFTPALVGWKGYEKTKSTLPEETIEILKSHQGWIVGPTFAGEYPKDDPVRGHPNGYIRKNFGLFANIRPVVSWPQLDPLVPDVDIVVMRENTQGFYPDRNMFWGYGEFKPTEDVGLSLRVITRDACERFARLTLEYARATGQKRIQLVHKRTALPQTDGIFISAFETIGADFPEIEQELLRVDTFSSSFPRDPGRFRFVATTNLFGDIMSDQASGLAGGVGMAPSLNAGATNAMAQAVHGTAPDIAGKNLANPSALTLSAALLMRWFYQRTNDERFSVTADRIEAGIRNAIGAGRSTTDLGGKETTESFAAAVVAEIESLKGKDRVSAAS
jgi:3-isopropylmalate dehydrogenase